MPFINKLHEDFRDIQFRATSVALFNSSINFVQNRSD
jgi:hypothetical protein